MFLKLVIVLCLLAGGANCEGEPCSKNGAPGVCRNIIRCPAAIEDLKRRINPQICGFQGADPIVCCVQAGATTSRPPVRTTAAPRPTTSTTEYVPPLYDYQDTGAAAGGCEPLPPSRTASKTGQKAWDKCIEYQETLVYPCEKGVALTGEAARVSHCGHGADELIVGGQDAAPREFPHMVILGFGDTPATAEWLCGGALISDWFIMTAGHCTSSRELGPVTFAIVGALKRSDPTANSQVYRIKDIIKHPDYKPPSKYNDLALLRTERQIALSPAAVPACLVAGAARQDKAAATGWGATQNRGGTADTLQKVTLTKFSTAECSTKYPANRNLRQGFNETTQLCYGDKTKSKDTCQGDSGGPLQVKSKEIECMYVIVGVTSFGRACGWVGEPGIYTRVQTFVPWIESVVWP